MSGLFVAVRHMPKIVPGVRWVLNKHRLDLNEYIRLEDGIDGRAKG